MRLNFPYSGSNIAGEAGDNIGRGGPVQKFKDNIDAITILSKIEKENRYATPEEQEKYDPELSKAIGWNCVQRRNFGFLWAHDMKADIVAVVDDES